MKSPYLYAVCSNVIVYVLLISIYTYDDLYSDVKTVWLDNVKASFPYLVLLGPLWKYLLLVFGIFMYVNDKSLLLSAIATIIGAVILFVLHAKFRRKINQILARQSSFSGGGSSAGSGLNEMHSYTSTHADDEKEDDVFRLDPDVYYDKYGEMQKDDLRDCCAHCMAPLHKCECGHGRK